MKQTTAVLGIMMTAALLAGCGTPTGGAGQTGAAAVQEASASADINGHAASPRQVPVRLNSVEIEAGSTSSDVRLKLTGDLPNTCYELTSEESMAVPGGIELLQYSIKHPNICLEVIVPFVEIVNLGALQSGDYQILDGSRHEPLGILRVAQGGELGFTPIKN